MSEPSKKRRQNVEAIYTTLALRIRSTQARRTARHRDRRAIPRRHWQPTTTTRHFIAGHHAGGLPRHRLPHCWRATPRFRCSSMCDRQSFLQRGVNVYDVPLVECALLLWRLQESGVLPTSWHREVVRSVYPPGATATHAARRVCRIIQSCAPWATSGLRRRYRYMSLCSV